VSLLLLFGGQATGSAPVSFGRPPVIFAATMSAASIASVLDSGTRITAAGHRGPRITQATDTASTAVAADSRPPRIVQAD